MPSLRTALMLMAPLLLQASPGFDPSKDIPISITDGLISMAIPPGAHLKTRTFRVSLTSKGVLRLGVLPPPDGQDEAGEPIWRGAVKVGLQGTGLNDPARLVITYQPCTEGPNGVCFLPLNRPFVVPVKEIRASAP